MKLSSLSILIPAYKDADTITTVVQRAVRAGIKAADTFEIVVIDDASPDKTGFLLDGLKKNNPELRVIHHAINKGYGETMKELYVTGKMQWLFTSPGDYQIDPLELLKLIPHIKEADMIIGWRQHRQETLKRKLQSYMYNLFMRFFFGVGIHDMNSVRLMKKSYLRDISVDGSSAFVDGKMTLDGIHKGRHVIEIPIAHRKRITKGASGGKLSIIIPVMIDMCRYKLTHLL